MAPFESTRLPQQCCGDGLHALVADIIDADLKRGQRGAENSHETRSSKKSVSAQLLRIG